jgi:hypothetical protein
MDTAGRHVVGSRGAAGADIDLLEADIAAVGVRTESGRLSQALGEVRQARVALGRLLGLVDVPGESSTSSQHARKAAQARWTSKEGGLMARLRGRAAAASGREREALLEALKANL